MGGNPLGIEHLREDLRSLLENSYSTAQLNGIVRLCHAIANAALKYSIIDGSAKQEYLGLRKSDLAFDCIAELFRKDEVGNLVQIQAYFTSLPVTQLSNEQILSHFRRVVQSKVNQGLSRIYQESDPTLGKILRSLKIFLQVVRSFEEIERLNETNIVPVQCDQLLHCTTLDAETLMRELAKSVKGSENIPQMMSVLAAYLRSQSLYQRAVPLMTVALAFRALYMRGFSVAQSVSPTAQHKLEEEDTMRLVHHACDRVKTRTSRKYLRTKGVDEGLFDLYFAAIEHYVCDSILGVDGDNSVLFGSLRNVMPAITTHEYRKHHRNTIEYLARLCRSEAINVLRKDYVP